MSSVRPTQAQRRASTRGRLVDASLEVFARKGFHAASLDEVAANAGVSKGAVYYHFSSKEDLFLTLLDEQFHLILDKVRANPEGAKSAAHLFLSALEAIPGWLALYLEFIAYAARTPHVRDEFAARFGRESRQQIAETLQQFATQPGVSLAGPSEEVATAVDAIMYGFAIARLFDPDAVPDRLVDAALLRVVMGDSR